MFVRARLAREARARGLSVPDPVKGTARFLHDHREKGDINKAAFRGRTGASQRAVGVFLFKQDG